MIVRMDKGLPLCRILVIACVLISILSCNNNKDKTIKADLATKAESDKDFAGVRFTVENRIVTLNGECPTEKARSKVEATAKKLYGVKSVANRISVSPVIMGTDYSLKEAVDSVLKEYPAVQAITKDSIVYLEGRIEKKNFLKLDSAITMLKPKVVEHRLTFK
jgi:osmotically-inducible protein OsmY